MGNNFISRSVLAFMVVFISMAFSAQANAANSISGTVTNNSDAGGTIMVGLSTTPDFAVIIGGAPADGAGNYTVATDLIGNPLPDGTYYVGAYVDVNGNFIPDASEPGGDYLAGTVTVSVASPTASGINFTIDGAPVVPDYRAYSLADTDGNDWWVNLLLENVAGSATSVVVNGGQLVDAYATYDPYAFLSSGAWQIQDNYLSNGGAPATPINYTFTVTDPYGTTVYPSSVNFFVSDFVANVQPSGAVSGPINFSWTDPAGTGQAFEVHLVDPYGSWSWTSGVIQDPNARSYTYDGPPLADGVYEVRFWLEQIDSDGDWNKSLVRSSITYQSAPDTDGDGVPDAVDPFPADPAAGIDSDGDGFPDEWAPNATAQQIFDSILTVDAFPNDPAVHVGPSGDISQFLPFLTGNDQRLYEFNDTINSSIEDWYERSGGTVQFQGRTVQALKTAFGNTDYMTHDANGLISHGTRKDVNHVWNNTTKVNVNHDFNVAPGGPFTGDFAPGNLIAPTSTMDLYANIGQTYKRVFARTQEDLSGADMNKNQVRVEVATLDDNGGLLHDLSDPAHPNYDAGLAENWAGVPGNPLSGLVRLDYRVTIYDANSGETTHENPMMFLKPGVGIVFAVFDETTIDASGTVLSTFSGRNRIVGYDVAGVSAQLPFFNLVQVKVEDQTGAVPVGSYAYGSVVDPYGVPLQITSFTMEDNYSGSGLFTFINYEGEVLDIHYGADEFAEQVAQIQDIYTMSLTATPTYVLVPTVSISGVVTNSSGVGGPVLVGLFNDPYATIDTGLGVVADPFTGAYTINGVPDGTYYLASYVDFNGNDAPTGPDVNEPVSMIPIMVTVAGADVINANIVIDVVVDSDGDGIGDFWDLYPANPNYALEPDTDGDGMADVWEIANFGDLTTADATTDFNNNGMLDVDEFTAGNDPTAPTGSVKNDFNNDGSSDILWRNVVTGYSDIWTMDATGKIGRIVVPRLADVNWTAAN